MRALRSSFIALAVAGALSNCGGGGGGGGGGSASRFGGSSTNERTGPADFSAEGGRNYGLSAVGADAAHAAGRTGAGVKVGVIDTGIDLQHKDFDGAIDPASIDIISGTYAGADDQGGHGTSVAGVILARRDGYDAVGVAPDATLLAVRAEHSCTPSCSFYYADLTRATDYAVANGAQVLNFSLGGTSLDGDFRDSLARATAAGRIVVAAAGNSAGSGPINPAAWLASADSGGLGIAVGAVDGANNIAGFSNRAGAAARDRFLVAPGVTISTSANGGGTRSVNGTSFAAPHVAGAAAVVWGAAPYLTGAEVVDILLDSATDLGAAGTDDTYGRGLLNLDQALQPLGTATIPTGATVGAGGAALASTSLSLGNAFGDALARDSGLDQAIMLDAYDRPFRTDLSDTVRPAAAADPLAGWLAPGSETVTTRPNGRTAMTLSMTPEDSGYAPKSHPGADDRQPRFAVSTEIGGTEFGVARGFGLDRLTGLTALPGVQGAGLGTDSLATPWLAMAGDGAAVTAGHQLGDGFALTFGFSEDGGRFSSPYDPEPGRKAALAEGRKRFEDGSVLGGQIGTLTESAGPLASTGAGAFDFGRNADTAFLSLFGATPLSARTTLFARMGWGVTDGSGLATGLLTAASDVASQSFALGASTRDVGLDGDSMAFTLSRPLRVGSGAATLAVPVGRTMEGGVLYREHQVDLSPSGAETDLELSWTVPTGQRQSLTLGGLMALEPGHVADAPPAYAVGAKYRLGW